MQVDVITTYSEFEKLRLNWDEVYQSDPEAKFFLSWIWLSQIFIRQSARWFILAAKPINEDSRYVAFFPFLLKTRMSKSQRLFINEIHMAGTAYWADYTGLICAPQHDENAINSICDKLKTMNWAKLYFKNFDMSDRRLDVLHNKFENDIFIKKSRERKNRKDNINNLICPYADLPDDFETYLEEKLSANSRQKFRRFLRKVENSEDFRVTHSIPETYERDLDILIHFWRKKWAQRKGKDVERLARTYREIMQQGLIRDIVYMPVLWRGETPLGVLGSFVDRQKKALLFFVGGRDESWTNPPPGLVLHAHSIRWAIKNGLKTYDFLRGDESYKYSYGATERRIKYIVVSTKSGLNLNRGLDPGCIDDVLDQSANYQRTGRLKEAEIGYRQVLEASPKHPTLLRRYGRFLYQNKRLGEARKLYQMMVDIDPRNAAGWRRLGRVRLALDEFVDAELALRRAVELSPKQTVDTHYYLGRALQGLGMDAKAKVEFETVLNLVPRDKQEVEQQKYAMSKLELSA